MFDRRRFLSAAAAPLALSALPASVRAQAPDAGYGTPAGVKPFGHEVYRARRARLMAQMKGGVAVIYGSDSLVNGDDSPGAQRQADFEYLTGIADEPGAALVLAPTERLHKEILFLRGRNVETEIYDGERLPLNSVLRRRTGFERIRRMSGLGSTVVGLASRSGELHYLDRLGSPDAPVPPALELYGKVVQRVPGSRITNNHGLIPAMRLVKESAELEIMRKAIAATERGHLAAMRQARPGMRERDLEVIIENEFRAAGAEGTAFTSIVGAGRNGAVLHYTGGDAVIRSGDMILCDLGARYDRYAADVTRTWPVDGRFTPEQRQVYETVFAAQEAARAKLRAGAMFEDLQLASEGPIRNAGHIDAYLHGLGHFVGLETHDAGDYSKPLPAGAVLTLEPGIYLADRGFGVRIEDQFLVTSNGSEHLSSGSPRTVAEIERVMAPGR